MSSPTEHAEQACLLACVPLISRALALACLLFIAPLPATAQTPPKVIASLDLCGDHYLAALEDAMTEAQKREGRVFIFSPYAHGPYGVEHVADFPIHRGNPESLLALEPDLVIGQSYQPPALLDVLARREIAFFAVPSDVASLDEIPAALTALAAQMGLEETAMRVNEELAPYFSLPAGSHSTPTALYLRPGAGGAGPGSFIHLVLEAAGFANWQQTPGWGNVDLEMLALSPPPDLMVMSFTALPNRSAPQTLFDHPLFHRPPARAEPPARLTMPGRYWVCPAPSLAQAIHRLRAARETMMQ